MSNAARCQLTTKDLTILEHMLHKAAPADEVFARVLRHKLSTAQIVFRDDVDPDIATINSRIDYTIDGGPIQTRTLVHGADAVFPGMTLRISTLRGLALLGMAEGDSCLLPEIDGRQESVKLQRIAYQPEAALRQRKAAAIAVSSLRGESSVVDFRWGGKPKLPAGTATPDDDDPGPQAA